MKILQISDIHLNRTSKKRMSLFHTKRHSFFTEERVNRVFEIINTCINKYSKPDCIVFTGDIFDKRHPVGQDYHDIFNIIKYIEDKIETNYCFMAGNHDDQTILRKSPLIALSHLFHSEIDENNKYGLAITSTQKLNILDGQIILAPWGTSIEDIKKLKENNKKCIVFMHCGVFDGKSHWVENDLELGNVPLIDIQSLHCPVGIGHFHGQTELAKNVWYCGSPECFTFGEQDQKKGALLWDFSQDEVKIIPISSSYVKYKTYDKSFLNIESCVGDDECYIRIKDQVTLQEYKDIVKKAKNYNCQGFLFNMTFLKPEKVTMMNLSKKIDHEDILNALLQKENSMSDEMKKHIIEKHNIIEQKLIDIQVSL